MPAGICWASSVELACRDRAKEPKCRAKRQEKQDYDNAQSHRDREAGCPRQGRRDRSEADRDQNSGEHRNREVGKLPGRERERPDQQGHKDTPGEFT